VPPLERFGLMLHRRYSLSAAFASVLTRPPTAFGARAASGGTRPKPDRADTVALLIAHGMNTGRIRRMYPAALRYDPSRILATIAALKALGVDSLKALDRNPRLLAYRSGCWEERLAVLRELNLDVAKVVAACPVVVGLPPGTLRTKAEALRGMGLNVTRVLRHFPHAFTYSEDRIRRTLVFLDGVGLDPVRVVNASPTVLSYKITTKLQPTVDFVTVTMGRNITELYKHSACFGYSLTGRLIPRHRFAVLHQKQHLSLSSLFGSTDDRFAKAFGQHLAVYREFVAQCLCD